jgi:hypothetical protein
MPGACYPALRRLPGRDSHPLEKRSVNYPALGLKADRRVSRHDAPWSKSSALEHGALRRLRSVRRECEPLLREKRQTRPIVAVRARCFSPEP